VTDQPAGGRPDLEVPRRVGRWLEASDGVVELADQVPGGDQGLIVVTVAGPAVLARNVGEDLSPRAVNAKDTRCAGKADRFQVPEQSMDRPGPSFHRAAHRVADSNRASVLTTFQRNLFLGCIHQISIRQQAGGATIKTVSGTVLLSRVWCAFGSDRFDAGMPAWVSLADDWVS